MTSRAADPIALVRAYRDEGDTSARARLVERYMPLVVALARRHRRGDEQLEDLVQVGSIGLLKAIDRFQPDRGAGLVAFAAPTIAGEIKHHLRDNTWPVSVPRETRESRSAADFVTELPSHDGDPGGGVALLAAESAREASEDRALVATALQALDARERRSVNLHFFCDLSQAEIARALRISQAQVSRLLRRAVARMHAEVGELLPSATAADAALTPGDGGSSVAGGTTRTNGGGP